MEGWHRAKHVRVASVERREVVNPQQRIEPRATGGACRSSGVCRPGAVGDDVPGGRDGIDKVDQEASDVGREESPGQSGKCPPLTLEVEEALDDEKFQKIGGVGETAGQIEQRIWMLIKPLRPGQPARAGKQGKLESQDVSGVDWPKKWK